MMLDPLDYVPKISERGTFHDGATQSAVLSKYRQVLKFSTKSMVRKNTAYQVTYCVTQSIVPSLTPRSGFVSKVMSFLPIFRFRRVLNVWNLKAVKISQAKERAESEPPNSTEGSKAAIAVKFPAASNDAASPYPTFFNSIWLDPAWKVDTS